MSARQFCVYEALNRTLGEVVVGVSENASEQTVIEELHRRAPPVWITRWKLEHAVTYRVVAAQLTKVDALSFAARYAQSEALKPYRAFISGLSGGQD